MGIGSELKTVSAEIISKSEDAKGWIRGMEKSGNNDSFIDRTFDSLKGLSIAISKLDELKKNITAYSE